MKGAGEPCQVLVNPETAPWWPWQLSTAWHNCNYHGPKWLLEAVTCYSPVSTAAIPHTSGLFKSNQQANSNNNNNNKVRVVPVFSNLRQSLLCYWLQNLCCPMIEKCYFQTLYCSKKINGRMLFLIQNMLLLDTIIFSVMKSSDQFLFIYFA